MELWLDPSRKHNFAFISHAHADHAARHKKILCTPPTSRILKHRLGVEASIPMDYGDTLELAGGRVSLHPSGHILGAAQILVERSGERLLYSGDFKLKPSRTAEPCEAVPCDHLIMECTYGRPHYRFPDRADVEDQLVDCIRGILDRGAVPVVLAYALGRAQEVTRLLTARGFTVAMERRIHEISEIYEELGVELGPFEDFDPESVAGKVLIFPPHLWKAPVMRDITSRATIAVTGWAVDGRQRSWYRSDYSFPLSDHADFDDLIRFVETTGPRHVYLVHGFSDFAEHLARLDVSVHFLS